MGLENWCFCPNSDDRWTQPITLLVHLCRVIITWQWAAKGNIQQLDIYELHSQTEQHLLFGLKYACEMQLSATVPCMIHLHAEEIGS